MKPFSPLPCGAWLRAALLIVASLGATEVWAVINAGLQPYDLFRFRYTHVFVLTVEQAEPAAATVSCQVTQSFKGTYQPGTKITLTFSGVMKDAVKQGLADGSLQPGRTIAVFAGRSRQTREFMLYADTFYLGQMTDPSHWEIAQSGAAVEGMDGAKINTLAGTWNGETGQLIRLLADIAAGRDHFPRKAYARFREDRLLDKLDAPVTAVGVYDLEGDGDLDVIVCSEKGDRIYLQQEPMKFADATTRLGLATKSRSVCLADVNADGLTDVLAGAVLLLGRLDAEQYRLSPTAALPADLAAHLKTAAFAELNGDGFPDIVASVAGGGLRTFLNDGQGAFRETTQAAGLDRPECGAKGDGFVAIGDWNGDLRQDLFYAAGRGFLLVQDGQGVFQPVAHSIDFKFTRGVNDEPGRTGAGVFLPLRSPDRMDLIVPLEDGWIVVANEQGRPVDITKWGNEISEGSNDHLGSIADDWNLDGHVDFFTISDAPNGFNRYIVNRGYGSFMLATVHKYYEHMFKGPAIELGGRASASGDLDDDGAPDLVLGNSHGQVSLLLNDTLATRAPVEHPTHEIEVLQNTRLLTVTLLGTKGVANARIRLLDLAGQPVARRDLGTDTSSGSCGPNQVTLAVRQPGQYRLAVQYADGLLCLQAVDLRTQPRTSVVMDRGEKEKSANGW